MWVNPAFPKALRRASFLPGLLGILGSCGVAPPPPPLLPESVGPAGPRLLIRSDDLGFSHGANAANERLSQSGLVMNVSILFCAPWYREAVEILKRHPGVSVGVHLCANSEWKNYRWGPVVDGGRVPSLVDPEGHFWGSYRELNVDRSPAVAELEIEFRAQIDRALRSGIRIDYVDNHMGAGLATPEQREMVRRVAADYGLGVSGSFGERAVSALGRGDLAAQRARVRAAIGAMRADSLYLMVFHAGTDTPELRAMEDLNAGGVRNKSEQRQIELDILLSADLREDLERSGVRLVTYRSLNGSSRGRSPDTSRPEEAVR